VVPQLAGFPLGSLVGTSWHEIALVHASPEKDHKAKNVGMGAAL
jgi:hypothetical protein